jgi:hypothetical protein
MKTPADAVKEIERMIKKLDSTTRFLPNTTKAKRPPSEAALLGEAKPFDRQLGNLSRIEHARAPDLNDLFGDDFTKWIASTH